MAEAGVRFRGGVGSKETLAWSLSEVSPHYASSASEAEDLAVVCSLPPVLSPTRPGDRLVLVVGSALRQVSSHIGLDLLDPSEEDEAELAPEPSSPRMRGVQTSPGPLFRMAEAHEEAVERRRLFHRQSSERAPPGGVASSSSGPRYWGLHTLAFGAGLTDGLFSALGVEEEEPVPPVRHIRELGLPPILARRASKSLASLAASASVLSLTSEGLRLSASSVQFTASMEDRGASGTAPARDVPHQSVGGLAMGHASTSASSAALALPEAEPLEADQELGRSSILDFEHLFMNYYVEVRPRRGLGRYACGARGAWRLRCAAGGRSLGGSPVVQPALPTAEEVAAAWKAEAAEYILENADACQLRWQGLRLSRRALERSMEAEVRVHDELRGPRARVVLSLEPERAVHRLFWAIGDAAPPARALQSCQAKLQARWPHCRIRCADDFFRPPSVFHAVLAFFTVALVLSVRVLRLAVSAVVAAQVAPVRQHGRGHLHGHRAAHLEPSREERLDQLAARVLLTGSLAQLWMLHAMAASFPLRSLHSPFKRDLGCLAAYSPQGSFFLRVVGPLASAAVPLAMAVRFDRLGLSLVVPKPGRPVGLHTGALLCSVSLPFLTGLVGWSVRSSLYSHHHLFIVLLFLAHLGTAFGFAAYFEMVKWAVYVASANILGALFLYFRYTAEFTSARLLKAAQLQWACAHVVPVLGLLLAAALEVESGVARALVDFICENQDVIPTSMCIRILRNADH